MYPERHLRKTVFLPRPGGLGDSIFPGHSDIRLLTILWRRKKKIEKCLSLAIVNTGKKRKATVKKAYVFQQ